MRLFFKPHPFTGRISAEKRASVARIKELCRSAGAKVLANSESLYDAMNWSDIIICDISSVLNDYLMTDKPIIMSVSEVFARTNIYAEFPSSRAAYILRESSDLAAILADIDCDDSLAATRAEVRRECFGDGSAMERFTAALVHGMER